jgi:hypothetical protein
MASGEITIRFDPEAKAAMEALTDQIKALRDLLETKAGTENHYHYHQPAAPLDGKELDRLARRRQVTWHA